MAKPGPRPKDPAYKKSMTVGLRITPGLHARLSEEAEKAERSLSHEIEYRLRRSLDKGEEEQKFRDRFGDPTNYWLLLIAGNLIRNLKHFTGELWWRDPYTHRQLKIMIFTMLDCFKPPGRARTPPEFSKMRGPLGQHLAERELANIEATLLDPDPPLGWNWGGMTVTEWRQAAEWFRGKLKQSPLAKLYGIERTKK